MCWICIFEIACLEFGLNYGASATIEGKIDTEREYIEQKHNIGKAVIIKIIVNGTDAHRMIYVQ